MTKCFVWVLFCFLSLSCVAQKANYKQAERFMSYRTGSLIGTISLGANYLKKSEKFWYAYLTGDGLHYYFVDPKAKSRRKLFDRDFVAQEISKVTHVPVNIKELDLRNIEFKADEKTMKFKVDTFRFEYNIDSRHFVKIDSARKKPVVKSRNQKLAGTYSPDSTHVVYAKSHNLYLFSVKNSVETQLTTDGMGYSFGHSDQDTSTRKVSARVMWFANSAYFLCSKIRSEKGSIAFCGE